MDFPSGLCHWNWNWKREVSFFPSEYYILHTKPRHIAIPVMMVSRR